jgi:hypothetical protein
MWEAGGEEGVVGGGEGVTLTSLGVLDARLLRIDTHACVFTGGREFLQMGGHVGAGEICGEAKVVGEALSGYVTVGSLGSALVVKAPGRYPRLPSVSHRRKGSRNMVNEWGFA